jgi:hypothetical protein
MNYLELILETLGLTADARWDAKYTAALDLQLEELRAQTYDIKYPELKARKLVPVDNSVDPGAEAVAYHQWDDVGMANIIANYADDLPMVDALAEKFTQPIHGMGDAYQYSVQDLRRAAMAGNQLDTRRPRAARRAIERRIDDIAATGHAKGNLKGLINHPNVTILSAANDGTSTRWVTGRSPAKAPDLIKADMHAAVTNIWTVTKQVHQPNTILLPTVEYGHISQQQVGTENQTTILQSFLANNPFITMVDFWYKLDTADAAGTGPRMVTYQRDPEVLQLVIPQDFEQFPPQAKNLAFIVPCHARIGGVQVYYPLAIVYTDGL